jgi:hypothetical protein
MSPKHRHRDAPGEDEKQESSGSSRPNPPGMPRHAVHPMSDKRSRRPPRANTRLKTGRPLRQGNSPRLGRRPRSHCRVDRRTKPRRLTQERGKETRLSHRPGYLFTAGLAGIPASRSRRPGWDGSGKDTAIRKTEATHLVACRRNKQRIQQTPYAAFALSSSAGGLSKLNSASGRSTSSSMYRSHDRPAARMGPCRRPAKSPIEASAIRSVV